MKVTQPNQIPWLNDKGEVFRHYEEWYTFRNYNKDMRVILTLETAGMKDDFNYYNRPPFPVHWARMQGKGRVMYTALGHFNEFWEDANWMKFFGDCFAWILRDYNMDMTPNIDQVTPGAFVVPRQSL